MPRKTSPGEGWRPSNLQNAIVTATAGHSHHCRHRRPRAPRPSSTTAAACLPDTSARPHQSRRPTGPPPATAAACHGRPSITVVVRDGATRQSGRPPGPLSTITGTPPPLRLEMCIVACVCCVISRNKVEANPNIMASLSRGAPKAKSCVLDLGLDVLDLEGNGPWGMITANQI